MKMATKYGKQFGGYGKGNTVRIGGTLSAQEIRGAKRRLAVKRANRIDISGFFD